jgi:hypothetical protein
MIGSCWKLRSSDTPVKIDYAPAGTRFIGNVLVKAKDAKSEAYLRRTLRPPMCIATTVNGRDEQVFSTRSVTIKTNKMEA